MKLRLELLLVPLAAGGALWLVADVRSVRPRRAASAREAVAAESTELRSAELQASTSGPGVPAVVAERRATPPAEESRPEAAAEAQGISRGRLVDEATLEPIPDALVVTGKTNAWSDRDGWFDTGTPLDALTELVVLNIERNTNSHEIVRACFVPRGDSWEVPLAIGPTYRLRLVDATDPRAVAWEARLVQEGTNGRAWRALCEGPRPYLRYDAPIPPLPAPARAWIEARSLDGLEEGRGNAYALVGVQEVEVACRPRVVLRGRVVDGLGRPRAGIAISAAHQLDGEFERLRTETGPDGRYQLSPEEPGRVELVLASPFDLKTRSLELVVARGLTHAPDVVLDREEPAGAISGQLRSRTGLLPDGNVRLRALNGSDLVEARWFAGTSFSFAELPAGRYELSVSSRSEGYRWSPAVLVVEPPAEDLVFTREDAAGLRSHAFHAVDAETGAELERVLVGVRTETGWERQMRLTRNETFLLAADVPFTWRVHSRAHRLTGGTERDFQPWGEVMIAEVALRKGYGQRLFLREWSEGIAGPLLNADTSRGAPQAPRALITSRWRDSRLAGARILADGVHVATSDEHGLAELDLPAEPRVIEVRLDGWRVVESPSFQRGKALGLVETEVLMIRE